MKSVVISKLTKPLAQKNAHKFLQLHNIIPFQFWTESELLADRDDLRQFRLKWDISCFAACGTSPIGFCISFHHENSQLGPFLYVHRLAVAESFRRRGIGRSLVLKSAKEFSRIRPGTKDVVVQTPIVNGAESAAGFYSKLGFRILGRKEYVDRSDWILRARLDDLLLGDRSDGCGYIIMGED